MVGDIERLLEGQDGPPRSRQPGGPTGLGCAAGPAEAGAPPAASRSPPHGPDPGGGRPSRSDGAARSVAGKGGAAPLSASASWPRSPRGEQSAQPVALPPAPGAQQERLEPAEAARAAEALAEWRPGQRGGGGSVVFGGGGTFEVGAPVERLRDRLLEWTVVFSEHFEGRVYLRELVGQTLFGLLGPLGVPLLRVYYGTSEAIQNRQMTWPSKSSRTWQEYRALVLFASVGWLSGLSLCSALVIWFFWAPEGTSAAEIWLMCAAMFMMNNTRAIKYAHFPLASYRQFDTTLLRLDRVVSGLVLVSWLKPSQKTIDDFLDLSMLTVLGPVPRHTKLRFLRWPTTMHRAQTIAKRQGLSSRAIVCHALLRRQPAAAKCMHSQGSRLQAPDFALELPPGLAPTGAVEGPAECDGPSSHEVALEELFREIVEAAVRWEQKTLIGRAGPAVPLGALATAFLGCFGRLASGRPFFGAGWLTNLQVALVLLPTLLSGGPCVGFIFLPPNLRRHPRHAPAPDHNQVAHRAPLRAVVRPQDVAAAAARDPRPRGPGPGRRRDGGGLPRAARAVPGLRQVLQLADRDLHERVRGDDGVHDVVGASARGAQGLRLAGQNRPPDLRLLRDRPGGLRHWAGSSRGGRELRLRPHRLPAQ
ncbi:unnamed protein product, partial [Prorocentrum cordatum]